MEVVLLPTRVPRPSNQGERVEEKNGHYPGVGQTAHDRSEGQTPEAGTEILMRLRSYCRRSSSNQGTASVSMGSRLLPCVPPGMEISEMSSVPARVMDSRVRSELL